MSRVNLQPAYILHSRPYRENGLLLDVLTLEHGKIALIARSARGLKSRFRGMLQAFTPLLISWVGKTDLMTLCDAEMANIPIHLCATNLLSGLYINELLVRLLERYDPHPEIYILYQTILQKLALQDNLDLNLRLFEKSLLQSLGYALEFNKEAETGAAIRADYYYIFDPSRGFLLTETPNIANTTVVPGASILALANEQLHNMQILHDAKRIMRIALQTLLGNKPLNSRNYFNFKKFAAREVNSRLRPERENRDSPSLDSPIAQGNPG